MPRHSQYNASSSQSKLSLRLVIVGHVDHGKSTLIGRLLADTHSLPDGKIDNVRRYCEQRGKPFEYAYLLDALEEEQEQGITIDTTQIPFRTEKRDYVIIDAPGHKEFLKNMVSGAASAEVALLLIDAEEGIQEQSKRHGYILSLLGIRELIVIVNKMDRVGYSRDRFNEITRAYRSFLMEINLRPRSFIPVSATLGENVAKASDEMSWYQGETVLEALDAFEDATERDKRPLRMPVQDIYKFDERRIIAGRIESGQIDKGDSIIFWPAGSRTKVKSIERWQSPKEETTAIAGESIGITLEDPLFVERGAVVSHLQNAPHVGTIFVASLFWMGQRPLTTGRTYRLKMVTQEIDCEIYTINRVIDAVSLEERISKEHVDANDVAEITVKTKQPVAFDLAEHIPETGRFVLLDGYDVSGGGIITGGEQLAGRSYERTALKSRHVSPSKGFVTPREREERLGQKGHVIWFTGLPGSGKTTLARALERRLFDEGKHVYLLEGETIRFGLSADLGFSDKERSEQTRRLAEVANLFKRAGIITIVTSVSPFREDRQFARKLIGPDHFTEVYANAPLEVCKKRDPHGIYTKAERGEIMGVTGIDSPYEPPENPDVVLETGTIVLDEMLDSILKKLTK